MIFSCTNKVIKRLSSTRVITAAKYENRTDNWYVDQLVLERRKFFLFTNSISLFSFLVNFGTKKEIVNFNSVFVDSYKEQIVRLYGLDNDHFEHVDENIKKANFNKTNSRSILGSMNDFKQNATARVQQDGLNGETLNSINYYLNQMPMGALKFNSPFTIHGEQIKL